MDHELNGKGIHTGLDLLEIAHKPAFVFLVVCPSPTISPTLNGLDHSVCLVLGLCQLSFELGSVLLLFCRLGGLSLLGSGLLH